MSNPRPCECGHRPGAHAVSGMLICRYCWAGWPDGFWCARYRPAKRTEPLRAKRGPTVPVSVLREFLDAERERWASSPVSLAYYGGAIEQLDRIRKRFCD